MGALINIFMYSIGSIFLGVLLTVLGIFLMFIFIRLWWKKGNFTPFSFLVGVILFFFLSFQSILLCGAVTIKSYCDDVEYAIDNMVSHVPNDMVFTQEDSQALLHEISLQWPLVGYYVDLADFEGHTPSTIAFAMTNELRSFMNCFILRRLGWSLLFILVGAIIVIKTISFGQENTRRRLHATISRSRVGGQRRRQINSRH